MDRQGEDIDRGAGDVGRGQLLVGQDIAERIDDAGQGQRDDHDEVGCDENGVAHVAGHPRLHVATPGQGIVAEVLQQTVERHGNAGHDGRRHDPPHLFLAADGDRH